VAVKKRCACGRSYSEAEWETLPYVGVQKIDDERLEIRNCVCGSSITVRLPSPSVPSETL